MLNDDAQRYGLLNDDAQRYGLLNDDALTILCTDFKIGVYTFNSCLYIPDHWVQALPAWLRALPTRPREIPHRRTASRFRASTKVRLRSE